MKLYELLVQLHHCYAANGGDIMVQIESSGGEYSPVDVEEVTVTGDGDGNVYVLLTDQVDITDAPSYDDLSALGYMDGIDYADPTANG